MNSSSIKFYVIGGLILGALSFFIFRKRPESHPSTPSTNSASNRTEILPGNANTANNETRERTKALTEAKKRATTEIFAGLKRIAARPTDKGLQIQVRPKTDGSACQVGDFDQIKSLTEDANENIFLLTVESMSKKTSRPLVQPLTIAEIALGTPYSLTLSPSKEIEYYGIYLCTARKDRKSCSQKPVTSRKEWRAAARGKTIADRILHFQMMSVRKSEVFLLPSQSWDKTTLLNLQKMLGGDGRKLQAPFQRMHSLMDGLASLSAGIRGPLLELNLPYRGMHCN